MLRQVYTKDNVLQAAKRRISYIFDEFENIVVSISGGKDSTAMAHLALSEAHRRGRKIGVMFIDEEVVYESTVNQVKYIMTEVFPDNAIPLWLQFEFKLTNATSLTEGQLVCWEAGKHKLWMHPKMSFAIQHKPWDRRTETVRYSKIYDYMWKKGMNIQEIRVSSLIHEKSFKALVELPEFEPRTYNRLIKRIKGIQTAHIYGKESKMLKCRKLPEKFKCWREYRDYLLDTYPDAGKKPIFERRFARQLDNDYVARQQCRQLVLNDYENDLPVDNKEDPRVALIAKWRELL